MLLSRWARKYNVTDFALEELQQMIFQYAPAIDDLVRAQSEAAVLNLIRLEASQKGARLWRNNVGAVTTDTGSFVRFGLANESVAQNKVVKSADLIGIRPVKISSDLIGLTIGQFISREVKRPGWKYKETPREHAQLAWANLINSMGGDAQFCTGTGTL